MRPYATCVRQRGLVLVTTLLLLIVVTLLGVGMFHSFGLDEKIAGNMRDKQLALQAAESAEYYAENWLANGNGTSAVTCSTPASTPVVCSNALPTVVTNVAVVPWLNGTNKIGYTYTPPNMTIASAASNGTFYASPVVYISWLGAGTSANYYQIDAVGYGGNANTTAIVESTYMVSTSVKALN